MNDWQCYCDECSGIAEPPNVPGPCGFPRPDVPGEMCGEYEGHDGEHGNWSRIVKAPGLSAIKHPVIDVWAVLSDPEIPAEVGQRLLTRQRARAEGLTPDVVPEADKPFLARHIVEGP